MFVDLIKLLDICNNIIVHMVKHLQSNLKLLRNLAGISLAELSNSIDGVGVQALGSYEERGITPKMDTLISLVDFYNKATSFELDLNNIVREDLRQKGIKVDRSQLIGVVTKKQIENEESITISKVEFTKMIDTIHSLTQLVMQDSME